MNRILRRKWCSSANDTDEYGKHNPRLAFLWSRPVWVCYKKGDTAMENLSGKMKLLVRAALGVLASTSCLFAQSGTGNPVVLNFDSLTPPPQGCVDATEYLAGFGITVTTSPGAQVGACQNVEVSGNYFTIFSTILNLHPVSATLNFPQPLSQITFTRSEYLPAVSNGVVEGESGPNWTAMALNAQGQQVGNTVGERLFISLSPVPAVTYTISGNGITALQINGNNEAFAGFLAPPLDNLALQYGCPIHVTFPRRFASAASQYMLAQATSTAPNSSTLDDLATSCGFINFNWQQEITTWPCPSALYQSPSAPSLPSANYCEPLSVTSGLTAPPAFYDPPPGGYSYSLLDKAPFYYSFLELTPGGTCPLLRVTCGPLPFPYVVDTLDTTLSFLDGPANRNLKGVTASPNPPTGTFMAFQTTLVGVSDKSAPGSVACGPGPEGTLGGAPLYCSPLSSWTWNSTFNGTAGGVSQTASVNSIDPGSGTGGVTITSINGVPQTPPSVTCSASPNSLWPPNGKSVLVTVSGSITQGTQTIPAGSTTLAVTDEYGQDQPTGSIALGANGGYSFAVPLIAARNGSDLNGRTYTINVVAMDAIGNVGSCAAVVTVPHDQGN